MPMEVPTPQPRRHSCENNNYPQSQHAAMIHPDPYSLATRTPAASTTTTSHNNSSFPAQPVMAFAPYPTPHHPGHHHSHYPPRTAASPPPHSYGPPPYSYIAPRMTYAPPPNWDVSRVTPNRETFRGGSCTCKKSKCLKLYCQCFASSTTCAAMCKCNGCQNTPLHQKEIEDSRKVILERNPSAFEDKFPYGSGKRAHNMRSLGLREGPYEHPAVTAHSQAFHHHNSTTSVPMSTPADRPRTPLHYVASPPPKTSTLRDSPFSHHTGQSSPQDGTKHTTKDQKRSSSNGCKCRKSFCLKKYCECFQNSNTCGVHCKCVNCRNTDGAAKARRATQDHSERRGEIAEPYYPRPQHSSQVTPSSYREPWGPTQEMRVVNQDQRMCQAVTNSKVKCATPSKNHHRAVPEAMTKKSKTSNSSSKQDPLDMMATVAMKELIIENKKEEEEQKSTEALPVPKTIVINKKKRAHAESPLPNPEMSEPTKSRKETQDARLPPKKRRSSSPRIVTLMETKDNDKQDEEEGIKDAQKAASSISIESHDPSPVEHGIFRRKSPSPKFGVNAYRSPAASPADHAAPPSHQHAIHRPSPAGHYYAIHPMAPYPPPPAVYHQQYGYMHPFHGPPPNHASREFPPHHPGYGYAPQMATQMPITTSKAPPGTPSGKNGSTKCQPAGLPKALSFRKICSKCGKPRSEHGDQGFGNSCLFQECGKCLAGLHIHQKAGQPMGFLCQLTVAHGAKPGAADIYARELDNLAARAEMNKSLQEQSAKERREREKLLQE